MKKLIFSFGLLILFYSCGSTKSSSIYKNPAFNSDDFFYNSITIYPPLSVSITNNKNSDYNEENVKTEITNMVKEKIEKISFKSNVIVGKQRVPDYIKGVLFKKDEADKFFKDTETKYLIIIQHVFVGEETKMQSMSTTTGAYYYNQGVTKLTMYFNIWNTESTSSVFSVEVNADVNEGLLVNSLHSSFDNAINEFISCVKKD